MTACSHRRRNVVRLVEQRVVDEVQVRILTEKLIELLCQIPAHDIDLVDPRGHDRVDQAIDDAHPMDTRKRFGGVHRDGKKPTAEARGQKHGPLRAIRLERRKAAWGHNAVRKQPLLAKTGACGIAGSVVDGLGVHGIARLCLGLGKHDKLLIGKRASARRRHPGRLRHGKRSLRVVFCRSVPDVEPLPHRRALELAVHGPHIPIPADNRRAGNQMEHLVCGGLAPEVQRDGLLRALDAVARPLRNEIAEIAAVVAHRSIFPIDEAQLVAVHEDVRAVKVVMAQNWRSRSCANERDEPLDFPLDFGKVRRERPVLRRKQRLNLARLVIKVERPGGICAALVQAPHEAQSTSDMLVVAVVKRHAIGNIAGNLPPKLGVLIDKRRIEPQVRGNLERVGLGPAVDDLIGASAWMAVHERLAAAFEVEREVRKPLLNRLHVRNIAALAVERRADVIEHVRGHVLDEQRVEVLQLVEGVELADLALLVGAHVHAKLVCVLEEDVVPQLANRLGEMVLLGQESHEVAGEVTRPVRMPHDNPRMRPADDSTRDALVATLRLKAVLVGFALLEYRRIIRVVDIALEGVAHEVIIRRADIRVADDVAHLEQRRVVVARRVIGVDDDLHTEEIF